MYKTVNLILICFFLLELVGCTSVEVIPEEAKTIGVDTTTDPAVPITAPAENAFDEEQHSANLPKPPRDNFKTPPPDVRGYVAQGYAYWYGLDEHGTKTASGQLYDLYGMTAAHATLPIFSRVRVINIATGSSVVVTINDRLYDDSVLIKLSYQAARHLGLIKRTSQVEVRGQ
jgi:rare lipoprotein A